MDTAREPHAGKAHAGKAHFQDRVPARARQLVREPFTARTWRRVAYALLAVPVALAAVPVGLLGGRAAAGRWQRGLVGRFLGARPPGSSAGVLHALLALPLNLVVAAVTLYGWSIVPMNIGWPLRGGDPTTSWGGPTFAGAWPCPQSPACPATPGTHSRRTGRSPEYVQYEGLRPARREHAPDAAGPALRADDGTLRTRPWSFHAVLGGLGFLLLMPWVGRGLAALQVRLATALLARP
ncbi:sensor domain-containing protein [Streptomyces sp. NPDC057620]|uniref:sensor domain-containing protein n=1 Tax=Streptomyces sp. NPDC057620 TaxID=3346185 RepID=UPI0036B59C34